MEDYDAYYQEVKPGNLVRFNYWNWEKKFGERKVIVKGFFFGKTKYHREYQCFMKAFDVDKLEERDFAVKDISGLTVIKF